MNLLIMTTHLNPGGISRYVINLSKGLTGNHNVWVAASGGRWKDKLTDNGVGFYPISINTKSILSIKVFVSFFKLIPFVLKNKIELISSNTRVTQFLSYLLYRALGIGYVSVFHGFYRPSLERRLFKFEGLETIAVSQAAKLHLVKDLKIKEERVKVIYNGIDKEEFGVKRCRKSDFGVNENDVVIGMLGRISEEKGHFLVVEAFRLLQVEHKNVCLLICGEGKLKEKLKGVVSKQGLKDRVRFLSRDAEDFLDLIDILVVASSREGFGFIVLEAFAKRVCVVASGVGGLKEIIKDKKNGVFFNEYTPQSLVEVLEGLLKDVSLREAIAAAGKKSLEEFSLSKMVKATEEVYKEILGRNFHRHKNLDYK